MPLAASNGRDTAGGGAQLGKGGRQQEDGPQAKRALFQIDIDGSHGSGPPRPPGSMRRRAGGSSSERAAPCAASGHERQSPPASGSTPSARADNTCLHGWFPGRPPAVRPAPAAVGGGWPPPESEPLGVESPGSMSCVSSAGSIVAAVGAGTSRTLADARAAGPTPPPVRLPHRALPSQLARAEGERLAKLEGKVYTLIATLATPMRGKRCQSTISQKPS